MADSRPGTRPDYRFARRPAWLAGHLLAGGMVVLMVTLGFWQLDRLDQRRDQNALVEARSSLAPIPVGAEIDPGDGEGAADDLRFRAVEATGTYTDAGVAVRATQGGGSGGRVFTVLDLGDGEAVLVLRGFVAPSPDGTLQPPDPPAGEVTVEGVAVPRHRLELVTRRALDDLLDARPELDGTVLPVVVQASAADDDALAPVPPPDLGDGPHLSYAVQWFLFSTVVAVGYPLLLRRRARTEHP
jgi:cytochrome oxidase assembly protein ShyY1